MKLKLLTSALAFAGMTSLALAQDYPAPVQALQDKGVEIMEAFDAPAGFSGYAGVYYGVPLAIYVTADGQHALVGGTLIDAAGNDLTASILDEKISLPQSEMLWSKLATDSHWVSEGNKKAATKVYVFTDPNCPYCKALWKNVQPWVKSGKVEIRHIPVGVLGESSRKKSAYILAAGNPTQAMIDNESGKAAAKENPIAPEQEQQLNDNLRLMQQLGASGTPAIFYRDARGMLQLQPGAAMGEQLVEIFGSEP